MKGDVVIKDPLVLNERIFTLCGSWPEKRVRARFAMAIVYITLYLVMQFWDLYDYKHNFDMVVRSVLEIVLTTTTYASLIILQRNKQLKGAIIEMRGYIAKVSLLEDAEKLLYHGHNNVAYRIGKYAVFMTSTVGYLVYLHPLIAMLRSHPGRDNSTPSYELPFRAHIIFDYTTDARMYSLLYLYQFPIAYLGIYHTSEVTFIINLVLHHCGRLSVLAYRIRNISTQSHRAFKSGIQKAVATHLELIESFADLNDSLSVILLLELLNCGGRLGLAMFVMLIKIGIDISTVISFALYSFIVCGWLFLYCYIGEQAISESQSVGDAFYEIDWPAMESTDKKSLLICILNGYKTLFLTAGKMYIFSLAGFTTIIKTSMGCLSMLQASM